MTRKRAEDVSLPRPFKVLSAVGGGWMVVSGIGRTERHDCAMELSILVPVLATPLGSLLGNGVVTRRGETLVITA